MHEVKFTHSNTKEFLLLLVLKFGIFFLIPLTISMTIFNKRSPWTDSIWAYFGSQLYRLKCIQNNDDRELLSFALTVVASFAYYTYRYLVY